MIIEVNEGRGPYIISDVREELFDDELIDEVLETLHRTHIYKFEDGATYRLIRE